MLKQAKTLSKAEVRRVLDYVATRRHAARNRMLVLATFYAGLRAIEVASLRYCDVLDSIGKVKTEIWLKAWQTKGYEGRMVYVNTQLQKELAAYIRAVPSVDVNARLFYTQKRGAGGFSANTLVQFYHTLYGKVGLAGASSHSGRRSFCTNLAANGVGVRVLMACSGHKSLAAVQRYLDVNCDMVHAAVELA
jgi:integrase/recombinase XerD